MQRVEQSTQKTPSRYFQHTLKAKFLRWTLNTHPRGVLNEQ